MTDHDALLAAILADPAEDTPRLAYADWLEENAGEMECPECKGTPYRLFGSRCGQCLCKASGRVPDGRAERAEFIRVQVELARTKCERCDGDGKAHGSDRPFEYSGSGTYPGPCPVCNIDDLRRRERELLELNAVVDWWGPHNEATDIVWTRGFVSSLTCTWDSWRAHADAILKAHPIERVGLTTSPDDDEAIANGCAVDHKLGEYRWTFTPWPNIRFRIPGWPPSFHDVLTRAQYRYEAGAMPVLLRNPEPMRRDPEIERLFTDLNH